MLSDKKGKRFAAKKRLVLKIIISIIIVAAAYLSNRYYNIFSGGGTATYQKTDRELMVHFLDVGQGDCIILQLPGGGNMIIDGGTQSASKSVLDYIDSYNIDTFDYVMLTHPDSDHSGGLDEVINNTCVNVIYMPDLSSQSVNISAYTEFLSAAEQSGAEIRYSVTGEIICGNYGLEMVFFTPLIMDYIEFENNGDTNRICPVIMLYYMQKSILFTADATAYTEELFLSAAENHSELKSKPIETDILKVAHHGSRYSSSNSFLEAVQPQICVISSGKNSYGHPHADTVERLLNHCHTLLRTDTQGNIVIKITADGVIVIMSEADSHNLKLYIHILMYILIKQQYMPL